MDEVPNNPADKTYKGSIPAENDIKTAHLNDQKEKEENNSNRNVLPSDDKVSTDSNNKIKINRYLVIAITAIIILLIVAYVLYHYNILGARILIRNTLGLSTATSTLSSGLNTIISSNFAGLTPITLSPYAASKSGINSTYFEKYAIFGEGNAKTAIENGSVPIGSTGLLILFGIQKTNETLGNYYKGLSHYTHSYNLTIGGMPAIEAIYNTTPPENSSIMDSYGAFNLTSYKCNSSGFNTLLRNSLNKTVKIVNASIYSIANMTQPNSTIFNSSIKNVKPNETFNLLFPEEKCKSVPYENEIMVSTNYSIGKLANFVSIIKFSPNITKVNQSEIITVITLKNSLLYGISAFSSGNNYVNELNSGFPNLIKNLTLEDFMQ